MNVPLTRRALLGTLGLSAAALALPAAASATPAVVHRNPWCGCCEAWAEHLEANGFAVTIEESEDLAPLKQELGVPARLESCHTALIEGYVVEGHVPAFVIRRLLDERPEGVTGLAVPGMPAGSPGMETGTTEPYAVFAFGPDGVTLYERIEG